MYQIELKNVTKRFPTKKTDTITAVDNFSLKIKKGECFAFLGPSGCGKTTTLRMVAGFEDLSEGEIYLEGKAVSDKNKELYIPPEERNLGMVFQAFAVWPHLNVFDNVAFPLQVQKRPKDEIEKRVYQALKQTRLEKQAHTFPSDLSGGEQQRIALARAIIVNPSALLLDEPLSNLDPKLRESMRFEIKRLQEEFGFTIIFVTHDQSEALAISDRILVMDKGKIVQVDTPENLYNFPINRFVHNFIGESNFTETEIFDDQVFIKGHDEPMQCDLTLEKGMILATRPSEIDISENGPGYQGIIARRSILAEYTEYRVLIGSQELKVQASHDLLLDIDQICYVNFANPVWYNSKDEVMHK